MKVGMIIGIAIGIVALLFGVVVTFVLGAIGGAAGAVGANGMAMRGALGVIVSLGLPIMAIVGGALAMSQPKAAVILMGIPGAVFAVFALSSLAELWFFLVLGVALLFGAYSVHRESTASGPATPE